MTDVTKQCAIVEAVVKRIAGEYSDMMSTLTLLNIAENSNVGRSHDSSMNINCDAQMDMQNWRSFSNREMYSAFDMMTRHIHRLSINGTKVEDESLFRLFWPFFRRDDVVETSVLTRMSIEEFLRKGVIGGLLFK